MAEAVAEVLYEGNVSESMINPSVSPFSERERSGNLPPF
jgi:hypothetical protein